MSKGFDTPDAVTEDLDLGGFDFVGRYYSNSAWKRLTPGEAALIRRKGKEIIAIFEDNPTKGSYFTKAQGAADAATALSQAQECGQPLGSPIYFTVDYDAEECDLPQILGYAERANMIVKDAGYDCGWYGSGYVLSAIRAAGFGSYFWLAQSVGWMGYSGFRTSGHANIIQGSATKVEGMNVDTDESYGDGTKAGDLGRLLSDFDQIIVNRS